ncbi:hypothetical protein L1987_42846 [Smallanthus sonchifolius]|uniref:Uncharacterized protein n=1 Tax=Smallanthus sonchifolius TaxID=185202 RepID=A0ACB9GKZ6_9ASTR|nr:hypothetical protein L1987_42846 [Smallanthus sonchifolius]
MAPRSRSVKRHKFEPESVQKALLEIVFNSFGNKDPQYIYELHKTCGVPEYGDWEKVRNVIYFLQVFYESTEKILGSHVTSNIFLNEIAGIDLHLDNWGKSSAGSEKRFCKALDLKWKYMEY